MASVHQKHPVPKVAVSMVVSGVELAGVESLFLLDVVEAFIFLFFLLPELSFCAQELNPMKLTAAMNKTCSMVVIFSITYAKVIGMDCITICCNKSLTTIIIKLICRSWILFIVFKRSILMVI